MDLGAANMALRVCGTLVDLRIGESLKGRGYSGLVRLGRVANLVWYDGEL